MHGSMLHCSEKGIVFGCLRDVKEVIMEGLVGKGFGKAGVILLAEMGGRAFPEEGSI